MPLAAWFDLLVVVPRIRFIPLIGTLGNDQPEGWDELRMQDLSESRLDGDALTSFTTICTCGLRVLQYEVRRGSGFYRSTRAPFILSLLRP